LENEALAQQIVTLLHPGGNFQLPEVHNPEQVAGGFADRTVLSREKQRPSLFDYQSDLVREGINLVEASGKGLISLPTGGGKTRTAIYVLLEAAARRGVLHTVWLAPTVELLDQAQATLMALWKEFPSVGDLEVMRSPGKPSSSMSTVIFLTPQSLFNIDSADVLTGWDLVVFDEAHQISAPKFHDSVQKILTQSIGASLLGLSATPGRSEEKETEDLVKIFGGNLLVSKTLGAKPVEFLQKRGILSNLEFHDLGKHLSQPLNQQEKLLQALKQIELIVKGGGKVLTFATSVPESMALAFLLNNRGVPSAHLDGETDESIRRAILEDFKKGKFKVLFNQKLLSTGYDCPAVSDVVIIPKIGSAILFEQMVGRAARGPRTGGTTKSRIWQFYDHLDLHGLPSSYYRYKDFGWSAPAVASK
jgi:superfamily II DNA or RNA helicase